jgi:hypothetical protein
MTTSAQRREQLESWSFVGISYLNILIYYYRPPKAVQRNCRPTATGKGSNSKFTIFRGLNISKQPFFLLDKSMELPYPCRSLHRYSGVSDSKHNHFRLIRLQLFATLHYDRRLRPGYREIGRKNNRKKTSFKYNF